MGIESVISPKPEYRRGKTELQEQLLSPELQKPDTLYHASAQRDIAIFEPRAESVRDVEEGPVVFATPDKAYASLFITPTDDSWTMKGRFSSDGIVTPWHMVISDRKRFLELDKGGAIYSLSANSFNSDPQKNLPGIEYTSIDSVVPNSVEGYTSSLEAMIGLGVSIYFVDEATFLAIRQSDDHGAQILKGLKPEYL
jgi:hypothetical protein